ncbi:MAG: phosphodiester glycosidase family protein, partial [Halanaerobiales bacterium]|nr:phosphodiester glycosidase family protein [Halanaerobiales bacterium]
FGQLVYEEKEDQETYYIYALGRVIAKREGKNGEEEKVYYYHHDNLGSTVLMTDGEGEVVFEQDYTPFGQDLYKAGTYEKPPYDVEAGMKYTGQIADVDTGLYYYNARYYDPEIGRFNREDDYQGDVFRPQTLNLFVYVLNNGLKYIDPTGNNPKIKNVEGEFNTIPAPYRVDSIFWDDNYEIEAEDGVDIEFGFYEGLKYILIKLNLAEEYGFKFRTGYDKGKLHSVKYFHEKNDALITINANFFYGNALVGDLLLNGKHEAGNKVLKERWYLGINDNNEFKFGRMKRAEDGYYGGTYLIPNDAIESNKLKNGIGGIVGLISNGEMVYSLAKDVFPENVKRENACRTAFGVNKDNTTAFIFVGEKGEKRKKTKGWSFGQTANFLYKLGSYNAVMFDGGGSSGLVYKNTILMDHRYYEKYNNRDRVISVLQVFK